MCRQVHFFMNYHARAKEKCRFGGIGASGALCERPRSVGSIEADMRAASIMEQRVELFKQLSLVAPSTGRSKLKIVQTGLQALAESARRAHAVCTCEVHTDLRQFAPDICRVQHEYLHTCKQVPL